MASATLNIIERAHQTYRDGRYEEALEFYTEALSMAKTKPQKIALHSNRAACYLKLHDFKKAAEECTSVLDLDQKHTGALMLRAQTLVTLKEYHCALFDVNRLMELNPSSEVYGNLYARLKTQLSLAPIPEAETETELEEEEEDQSFDEAESERDEEQEHKQTEAEANEEKQLINAGAGREEKEQIELDGNEKKHLIDAVTGRDHEAKIGRTSDSEVDIPQTQNTKEEKDSKGWQAIPQPKGHSRLDYSRWDRVEDDSSEDDDDDDDDDDDEDSQPRYRLRVRTVGVRQVK